jgi:hypothetical protein
VGDQQLLNVSVPRDVSSKDFARIGDEIIKIIKSHTGCTCLSGVIPVVLGNELKEAITVDLEVRA